MHCYREQRIFHGFYGHYCYLSLYIMCGDYMLGVRLRAAHIEVSAGSLEEIDRIVKQIRQSWPLVQITLRADFGFCRDALMSWCDAHQVDYALGLARNERLRRIIETQMQETAALNQQTGPARRVIDKAEQIAGNENFRYVVTLLAAASWPAQSYCSLEGSARLLCAPTRCVCIYRLRPMSF